MEKNMQCVFISWIHLNHIVYTNTSHTLFKGLSCDHECTSFSSALNVHVLLCTTQKELTISINKNMIINHCLAFVNHIFNIFTKY